MIIGPNGTGKSTFVAAVCIGLGGRIELIRKKSLDSMIKSGNSYFKIEIVLQGEPDHQITIRRQHQLKSKTSSWSVDNQESSIAQVRSIVSRLNIQLDNLCHFLPQERVAEFALMSPERLLIETERTIGDNTLIEKHLQLVDLDDEQLELEQKISALSEEITVLREDVEKFEKEAENFQQFQQLSGEIRLHELLVPHAKFQDIKDRMRHLKETRDAARQAIKNFSSTVKPLNDKVREFEQELQVATEVKVQAEQNEAIAQNELKDAAHRRAVTEKRALDLMRELANVETRAELRRKELAKRLEDQARLRTQISNTQPIDQDRLRRAEEKRSACSNRKAEVQDDHETQERKIVRLKHEIGRADADKQLEIRKLKEDDRIDILKSTYIRYNKRLLAESYKAHVFFRQKKKQLGLKYFEAPVVSCQVTDPKYAKYLEKVIDNNSLLALFFANEDEYNKLRNATEDGITFSGRVVGGSPKPPLMSREELIRMGFDGYLSDFVKGPSVVLQGLNLRSQLNSIPVALKRVDPEIIKSLMHPGPDGRVKFMKLAVESSLYTVSRSRYGSKQTFYQTESIGESQLLSSSGLTESVKKGIQERAMAFERKLQELKEHLVETNEELAKQEDLLRLANEEHAELEREVRALIKEDAVRVKLEGQITALEKEIARLTTLTKSDLQTEIEETEIKIQDLHERLAEQEQEEFEFNEKVFNAVLDNKKAQFSVDLIRSKIANCNGLQKELEDQRKQLEEKADTAAHDYDQLKQSDAAKDVMTQKLDPEETKKLKKLATEYVRAGEFTEIFIKTKINELHETLGTLPTTDGASADFLKRKQSDLEVAERQLPSFERQREKLQQRIANIAGPWESELSDMVVEISSAFQQRFFTVASDGQVELVKGKRFKDWKLEIKVKFRENAELKVLDHQSQSGGERAVSTIFFIMSLQGLTNAPIRIVDEINQGMDPKNEKQAHKYLVKTACSSKETQYFLVTPKLLQGLYYEEGMMLLNIFTGQFTKNVSGAFLDLAR